MYNSIFDLLVAPWTSAVVFAAVQLRLFTILGSNKKTIEKIASSCHALPYLLHPLLEACVSMGLVDSVENKYANSKFSSKYLVEGKPLYIGDLIQLQHLEYDKWYNLADIISSQKNALDKGHREQENYHKIFIKAMNNLGMLGEAEALCNALDLSNCKLMIDAGGGSGIYSIFLCRKYPELNSIILDKTETLNITKTFILEQKEKDRISLKAADITREAFGENVDVVLLSDVIYDEEAAVSILKNAWNCLHKDGILILRGYYSDPEKSKPLFGALFVLNQLVFDPTRKILTISDLAGRINKIGFTLTKKRALTEHSFIITARK